MLRCRTYGHHRGLVFTQTQTFAPNEGEGCDENYRKYLAKEAD